MLLKRITILFLVFLIHSAGFSQVKKVSYFEAAGLGTTSLLLLAEPIVMSLTPKIPETSMPTAVELIYSIAYKNKAKKGETMSFPCMPKTFTWRTGIDSRVISKPSRTSRDNGINRYNFTGGYIGIEASIPTIIRGMEFIIGFDFNYYFIKIKHSNTGRTIRYDDNKHYIGISPFIGLGFFMTDNIVIISEVNALVGFRMMTRNESSDRNGERKVKEDAPVFGLGIPRMASVMVYYLFNVRH